MPSREPGVRSRWAIQGSWLARSLVLGLAFLSVLAVRAAFVHLPLRAEAGYGDSYILYDVQQFQRTGVIYRDTSAPPYLPAQYSPLAYVFLSLPGRVMSTASPFTGPRLLVLAAFFGCIGLAWSTTRRMVPERAAGWWALGVAASTSTMWQWPLQVRADFPAACCSLLAIRALLSDRRGTVVAAGLAAGLAAQFKVTFIAAGLAGMAWLAANRDWRRLGVFTLAGAATSVGLYAAWALREPRMVAQMLALSPGVPQLEGALVLLAGVLASPAFVLGVVGVMTLPAPIDQKWRLVIGFCTVSFGVAALTSLQAGANVNYYFEGLFAVIPLVVLGVLRCHALPPIRAAVALGLLVLVVIVGAPYRFLEVSEAWNTPRSARDLDTQVRRLAPVLATRHTLSTVPWVALLDPKPSLTEPLLLSYLTQLRKPNLPPVAAQARARAFDAVFTAAVARDSRGVPHIEPALHSAIAAAYTPYCIVGSVLAHLPAEPAPDTPSLMAELRQAGCRPFEPGALPAW